MFGLQIHLDKHLGWFIGAEDRPQVILSEYFDNYEDAYNALMLAKDTLVAEGWDEDE